jgi:hypothetical protein
MVGTGFKILGYLGDTPSVAECRNCHVNFFTPPGLIGKVLSAERHLGNRFLLHACKGSRRNNLTAKKRNERADANWSASYSKMLVVIPYF